MTSPISMQHDKLLQQQHREYRRHIQRWGQEVYVVEILREGSHL